MGSHTLHNVDVGVIVSWTNSLTDVSAAASAGVHDRCVFSHLCAFPPSVAALRCVCVCLPPNRQASCLGVVRMQRLLVSPEAINKVYCIWKCIRLVLHIHPLVRTCPQTSFEGSCSSSRNI